MIKRWSSKRCQIRSNEFQKDIDWEVRPGGMIVQKRPVGSGSDPPLITLKVSHSSNYHFLTVSSHSTFGDLKRVLRHDIGLEPREQRLLFRGKEKENHEWLHMSGVDDMSKLILMEDPASKERKLEEMTRNTTATCLAVAEITVEVDKLSQKVATLEGSVYSRKKVEEKDVKLLTELLMKQLLKLDAIQTDDGNAKSQRRTQVVRVHNFVDRLDNLKAKSSNPSNQTENTVSIATAKWKAFESGFGSLIPPTSNLTISSTKITQDWEMFD